MGDRECRGLAESGRVRLCTLPPLFDEAPRLAKSLEGRGVFLGPVHTDRVMAAMIDRIRAGRVDRRDAVVSYSSGGVPAIFSHGEAQPAAQETIHQSATP